MNIQFLNPQGFMNRQLPNLKILRTLQFLNPEGFKNQTSNKNITISVQSVPKIEDFMNRIRS